MRSSLKRRVQKREEKFQDFSGRLVTLTDPNSTTSEAYRTLRTSVLYGRPDAPPKTIVMTSHSPNEGKSTTCANLAVVLAQAGKRTLLLDCDLRNSVLHKIFMLRNVTGLVDVLARDQDLETVLQEPLTNLRVATAGPLPPNPAELVGSRRFAEFLNRVREEYDYVLMDAPPVGAVSDPLTLATQADGVLLVLDAQKTRKANVKQAIRSLESVGANVLGTVMNNVRGARIDYYGAGYLRQTAR